MRYPARSHPSRAVRHPEVFEIMSEIRTRRRRPLAACRILPIDSSPKATDYKSITQLVQYFAQVANNSNGGFTWLVGFSTFPAQGEQRDGGATQRGLLARRRSVVGCDRHRLQQGAAAVMNYRGVELGAVLAGRYRIDRVLGQGGMGI